MSTFSKLYARKLRLFNKLEEKVYEKDDRVARDCVQCNWF